MANEWIKSYARTRRVRLWEVADAMKIHEASLSRLLRYDLPPEKQLHIKNIIDSLANNRKD